MPQVGEVLLELGQQFAWHLRFHTPESHQDVAYYQAEATGAGSSDFAREKYGRRVEYVDWQRKRESSRIRWYATKKVQCLPRGETDGIICLQASVRQAHSCLPPFPVAANDMTKKT
jgi:hypothetical protein